MSLGPGLSPGVPVWAPPRLLCLLWRAAPFGQPRRWRLLVQSFLGSLDAGAVAQLAGLISIPLAACGLRGQRRRSRGSIEDGYLHGGIGSNFFFQLSRYRRLREVPKCFLEVEFMDRDDVQEKLIDRRKESFPEIATEIAGFLLDWLVQDHHL